MDFNAMFPYMTAYIPSSMKSDPDFIAWLAEPNQISGFAMMLAYTLPGDRSSFYQTSSMAKMRQDIIGQVDDVTNALGFYPVIASTENLDSM